MRRDGIAKICFKHCACSPSLLLSSLPELNSSSGDITKLTENLNTHFRKMFVILFQFLVLSQSMWRVCATLKSSVSSEALRTNWAAWIALNFFLHKHKKTRKVHFPLHHSSFDFYKSSISFKFESRVGSVHLEWIEVEENKFDSHWLIKFPVDARCSLHFPRGYKFIFDLNPQWSNLLLRRLKLEIYSATSSSSSIV